MVKSTQEKTVKGKERKTSQAKAFINPSPAKSTKLSEHTQAKRKLTKQAQTKLITFKIKLQHSRPIKVFHRKRH